MKFDMANNQLIKYKSDNDSVYPMMKIHSDTNGRAICEGCVLKDRCSVKRFWKEVWDRRNIVSCRFYTEDYVRDGEYFDSIQNIFGKSFKKVDEARKAFNATTHEDGNEEFICYGCGHFEKCEMYKITDLRNPIVDCDYFKKQHKHK